MKKISVIVPVYNSEKTIEKCLYSLIKQSYKNLEIIVIDDGSIDNSFNIIKNIADKYENIIIYKKINSGVSDTRNFGIERATGDYISFVDSDDYVNEDMYMILVKNMLENDLVVCSWNDCVDEKIERVNIKEIAGDINKILSKIKRKDFFKYFNPPWNKLFKLDIIRKNKIKFNETIVRGEDYLFCLQYIMSTNIKIRTINVPLYFYMHSQTGLNYSNLQYDTFYNNYYSLLKEMDKLNIDNAIQKLLICEINFFTMNIQRYRKSVNIKDVYRKISKLNFFKNKYDGNIINRCVFLGFKRENYIFIHLLSLVKYKIKNR